MPAAKPEYHSNIQVKLAAPGVIEVRIRAIAYGQTGRHWKQQLSGKNAQKWGRLFIDPDPREVKTTRKMATWEQRGSFKGCYLDQDECPGAMFLFDGPGEEGFSHVEWVDSWSNQKMGRELYWALRAFFLARMKPHKQSSLRDIRKDMGWWEVRFAFF
ncbi:MAG: hypothetical protein ACREJB_15745 [Planctomycetaceae bacterium]